MTRPYTILTILFSTVIGQLFGQDTTVYRQANASMFSNNYTFIKKNKSDNSGTFRQYSATDDMQYWYGHGVFSETKKKIYLTFDTTDSHNQVKTVSYTEHKDTLYIKWFDWWGGQQEWFSIRFADTTVNKSIYQADWQTGFVKILKTELKDKKLSLFAFSSTRKVVDFETSNEVDEVNIFANDSFAMHSFNKRKEVLKKTKDGFITVGMWTKNKKTEFVIRQK